MQQIELIRAINSVSERYYATTSKDINNHQKYLEECNEHLLKYFKDTLGDSFIFSALSYINYSTEKIELVIGNDQFTKYNFNTDNEGLKKELKISLEAVLKGEIIGMTAILLSKKNKKDFFLIESIDSCNYHENIKIKEGNIFYMPLADMVYTELYEDFKKENQQIITDFIADLKKEANYEVTEIDKIGKYLWHYKRMSKYYTEGDNKPFYVHFIRPSIIDFDHNLLLSLATNTCLTQEHLAFINLFIYRIVAQMAIELKAHKADREFVDKALAYKHTIFNLFPIVKNLLWLAKNHKEANKSQQAIEKLEKNISVWDICNRSIYNHIEKEDGHILSGKSIIDIITFLKETHTIKGREPILTNLTTNKELDYSPNIENLADSFIVLWNFWHNASKISAGNGFEVVIFEANQKLLVTFKNQVPVGELSEKANNAIRFLKDESTVSVKKNGGTEIAKQIIAKKLNWQIDPEQTYFKDNIFSLTIHLKPLQL
jgi:hypothetical protein